MFEDRSYKRTFYSAPQSVTSLVAAFLEPTLTVLVFLLATVGFDEPFSAPTWRCACWCSRSPSRAATASRTNCSMPAPTSWPHGSRCWRSWRCAATRPAACILRTRGAAHLGRCDAAAAVARDGHRPDHPAPARRAARVAQLGGGGRCRPAGRQGGARAAGEPRARAVDFVGYFDDRTDERVDAEAAGRMLGTLRDVAPYIRDARHQGGLHHAAAGLAAAHPRAARAACRAPPRRSSSCPTCSASASSRAACRT